VPHNKKNLTADFKPTRPTKAVMGGEDFTLTFYGGPPFRYEKALKDHTNFVNCVRYSPDGNRFISVSSDKTGLVYDGTTATLVGKLDPAQAHTGSIYAVAWSPDGTRVATASGGTIPSTHSTSINANYNAVCRQISQNLGYDCEWRPIPLRRCHRGRERCGRHAGRLGMGQS
jgi:WD40 repeat protein